MNAMTVSEARARKLIQAVKFDDKGLATAIVLDADSGQPLMCAFVNRESLTLTLTTGKMTYWSRSRQELWIKGQSSGHEQIVQEIRIDCDGDALLFRVHQKGAACHTGHYSCFYRKLGDEGWAIEGAKLFDPEKVYGKP
jgi:phosphoribosyl-AMP cyclohydrolase